MSEVSLEVNGRRLSGWKRIIVERELGSICGRFSLGLLDSWEKLSKSWFITPFSSCKVYFDNDLVLTGYVDNVSISKNTSGTDIQVAGRDITSDLVDCSAILKSYEYVHLNISQLARMLLKPFGIAYVQDASPGKTFPLVQIDPGNRVASVLQDHARYRGVFFMSSAKGELVLVKPGKKHAAVSLVIGQNIKSFQVQYDTQQRFSKYQVLLQNQGDAEAWGQRINQPEGTSIDKGVPRYRPLSFAADLSGSHDDGKKRAQWEATVRAAKMTKISVQVVGWRQGQSGTDPLWEVNSLVHVEIPEIGLNDTFLISSVEFSIDVNGGAVTNLAIEETNAYDPEPIKDPGAERFLAFSTAGDD